MHNFPTMNEADQKVETRRALAQSQRWADLAAEFPLMAVAHVGPISMNDWTPEVHVRVRRWAYEDRPYALVCPEEILEYQETLERWQVPNPNQTTMDFGDQE